jgi:hypothetical protein
VHVPFYPPGPLSGVCGTGLEPATPTWKEGVLPLTPTARCLLGQHFSEAIQATGNKKLYGTCCHHEKSYGNQNRLQFTIHVIPFGSGEDARPFP